MSSNDTRRPSTAFCYGRSAHGKCHAPAIWLTEQPGNVHPFWACGRHLAWLIRLRAIPTGSLIVTHVPTVEKGSSHA